VYAAGLAAKNVAYARGWVRARRLEAPVISVGNLSVGGAGKTPLVIRLAEVLAARGFAVDVLSRGYGRSSGAVERVVLDGEHAAGRFGDEPLLIARASGVPVYVGSSRYEAGVIAEGAGGRLHLLDDGFQHRQLARAVDIVVLHRNDFGAGLLPSGRLREPLTALRRASVAVLRVEDGDLEAEVRRVAGWLPVWQVSREIVLPTAATGGAVAFCGIAHPVEFFRALAGAGALLVAEHVFRDHHVYTDEDVGGLIRSVRETGARRLLTTEKDLVRLSGAHLALLEKAAVVEAVPLRARLVDEDAVVTQMLGLAGLGS
jgi:tetraacyldisaccharide 4'-kinase